MHLPERHCLYLLPKITDLMQPFDPEILHPELRFQTSRSSGAGGQNVNKVNTRVELRFHISQSAILSDEQKNLLIEKLSTRITNDYELIIASEKTRSQYRNKLDCISRFNEMIEDALLPEKPRIATRPTRSSKIRRVENKKLKAVVKQNRKKPDV
jgi:ribosome-associated protein